MRTVQLLAVTAFCLPGTLAAGCDTRVHDVGRYTGKAAFSGARGLAGDGVNATAGTGSAIGTDAATSVGQPDAAVRVPSQDTQCAFVQAKAERHPLDLYIMMDANITLPFIAPLWEIATQGLKQFVLDPRSQELGVGIRYFGLECGPDPYDLNPTVEVGPLSATGPAIAASTNAEFRTSPMLGALQGGINHQRRRATENADRKQIVLLVSDGFTADLTCLYTEQQVIDAAASGYVDATPIETHVIGLSVAQSLFPTQTAFGARFAPLDSVATAGGSDEAILVEIVDSADVMNEAMQLVRRKAQPCDFLVPPQHDFRELSLAQLPSQTEIPRVDDTARCGAQAGWYFDDPSRPIRMHLCPASCELLRATDDVSFALLRGCPPKTR